MENRDYVVYHLDVKNSKGGRPTTEYAFTLEAGKHVAMLSGTVKWIAQVCLQIAYKFQKKKGPLRFTVTGLYVNSLKG